MPMADGIIQLPMLNFFNFNTQVYIPQEAAGQGCKLLGSVQDPSVSWASADNQLIVGQGLRHVTPLILRQYLNQPKEVLHYR